MEMIAKEYGRSKATIQCIIKKRKLTGTIRPQPRRGNPRILSEDQDLRLPALRPKPQMRSAQMSLFMGVSASTCERILKQHGFRLRKCRPKPILSPKNIQDRLKWARTYEHQDWQQVIFTDEVAFQIGDDFKSEWCWRESNTENEEKHLCIRKKGEDAPCLVCRYAWQKIPSCSICSQASPKCEQGEDRAR
jgi:transposase